MFRSLSLARTRGGGTLRFTDLAGAVATARIGSVMASPAGSAAAVASRTASTAAADEWVVFRGRRANLVRGVQIGAVIQALATVSLLPYAVYRTLEDDNERANSSPDASEVDGQPETSSLESGNETPTAASSFDGPAIEDDLERRDGEGVDQGQSGKKRVSLVQLLLGSAVAVATVSVVMVGTRFISRRYVETLTYTKTDLVGLTTMSLVGRRVTAYHPLQKVICTATGAAADSAPGGFLALTVREGGKDKDTFFLDMARGDVLDQKTLDRIIDAL